MPPVRRLPIFRCWCALVRFKLGPLRPVLRRSGLESISPPHRPYVCIVRATDVWHLPPRVARWPQSSYPSGPGSGGPPPRPVQARARVVGCGSCRFRPVTHRPLVVPTVDTRRRLAGRLSRQPSGTGAGSRAVRCQLSVCPRPRLRPVPGAIIRIISMLYCHVACILLVRSKV